MPVATDPSVFDALVAAVQAEDDGSDEGLARRVLEVALGEVPAPRPDILRDLHQARAFARRAVPHFWMTSGLCELTGHATIGPDYNGAHRASLEAEWGNNRITDGGFSDDLAPGDGPHRECLAIVSCVLQALAYRARHPGGSGVPEDKRFPARTAG